MQRETKEITTKSGKIVTINSYLTGPESNQVKAAMLAGINVAPTEAGEKPERVSVPLTASMNREPKLLEVSVISLKSGEVVALGADAIAAINLMPEAEYNDLIKQIDSTHKGAFPEAK